MRPEAQAETLEAQLRLARLDDYRRRSAQMSRVYPRKKQWDRSGIPHLTLATEQQVTQAQALQHKEEFRLSA